MYHHCKCVVFNSVPKYKQSYSDCLLIFKWQPTKYKAPTQNIFSDPTSGHLPDAMIDVSIDDDNGDHNDTSASPDVNDPQETSR